MSHHLEVMAIAAERDAVLQAMLDLGLSLKRLDEYDEYDDMVPDLGGSGREIIIGLSESKGATYLWGGTPELTSDLDLLRELSRKINVRTAAGHVHTASGMFFLAMAIDGQLKRLYAACIWRGRTGWKWAHPCRSKGTYLWIEKMARELSLH
jgi:hypothetical protein